MVVVMGGCGIDTPITVEENNSASEPIKIQLKNEIIVEDTLKVHALDITNGTNVVTIDGEISNSDELIQKIVFLAPDDNQDGIFMKVSQITKDVNASTGKVTSKVFYEVPEIHEVIGELNIEEKNLVEDQNFSVAHFMIPTPKEVSTQTLSKYRNTDSSQKLREYKSTDSLENVSMFRNSKIAIEVKSGYTSDGKASKESFYIKFKDLKLIEKKDKETGTLSFNLTLDGAVDVKMKKMTPLAKISEGEYKLNFETEVETKYALNLTAEGKAKLNAAQLAGDDLQCGTLKHEVILGDKESDIYGRGKIGGVKWRDNLCLGGVQFNGGFVPIIGNGKNLKVPLAVDIFLGMNANFELVVQGKISLSYSNLTKASIKADLKNEDPKKRLLSTRETYDLDIYEATGEKKESSVKLTFSGKLSGEKSLSVGIPVGVRIANLYVANLEPFAEIKLSGEVSTQASIDWNGNVVTEVCKSLSLKPLWGVYFGVGLSAEQEIKIDNEFFQKDIKDGFTIGTYFTYKHTFDDLLENANSCDGYDGEVSYDILPTQNGIAINNFAADATMSSLAYRIYDASYNLIQDMTPISDTSQFISFDLASGDYIVETFMKTSDGKKKLESKPIKLTTIPKDVKIDVSDTVAKVSWGSFYDINSNYTLCVSKSEINGVCKEEDIVETTTNSYTIYNFDNTKNFYVAIFGEIKLYDYFLHNEKYLGDVHKVSFSNLKVSVGEDQEITLGNSVSLSSTVEGSASVSYIWSENGEELSNYSYLTKDDWSLGQHIVTLIVTDDLGNQASDEVIVTVTENQIVPSGSSKIKKTGQTTSYTNYDDGYYQKGIAHSYTRDDTKEIVTDNVTGLMWQDNATITKQWVTTANYNAGNYSDTSGDTATTYCNDLTLGGYSDWRLPTRGELLDIVDNGRFNSAIDPMFVNTTSGNYWGATSYAGNTSHAWLIDFGYGGTYTYNLNYDKYYSYYVRCVRAGQ